MSTKKSLTYVATTTGLILLVPLIAMQFTDEVDWDLADFVIMGGMLFVTGLVLALTNDKLSNSKYRVVFMAAIVFAFLLIWAELAVGVFGTPWAGS